MFNLSNQVYISYQDSKFKCQQSSTKPSWLPFAIYLLHLIHSNGNSNFSVIDPRFAPGDVWVWQALQSMLTGQKHSQTLFVFVIPWNSAWFVWIPISYITVTRSSINCRITNQVTPCIDSHIIYVAEWSCQVNSQKIAWIPAFQVLGHLIVRADLQHRQYVCYPWLKPVMGAGDAAHMN